MNPYEPINSGEPLTEAPRSATPGYRCPKCKAVFEASDWTALGVYYGVSLINCDDCTNYSHEIADSYEDAWECGNGCFNHDRGDSPGASGLIETGWICRKGELHETEKLATNC